MLALAGRCSCLPVPPRPALPCPHAHLYPPPYATHPPRQRQTHLLLALHPTPTHHPLPPAAAVLVHCGAGVSRSATLAIGYLMRRERWSAQAALDLVRSRRSLVAPNGGFWRALCALEAHLGVAERWDGRGGVGGPGGRAQLRWPGVGAGGAGLRGCGG